MIAGHRRAKFCGVFKNLLGAVEYGKGERRAGCGRGEISIRGKRDSWVQRGFARETSLICSRLRLSNCSLILATESFSETIFNSKFHLEAAAWQSRKAANWACEIIFPFFSKFLKWIVFLKSNAAESGLWRPRASIVKLCLWASQVQDEDCTEGTYRSRSGS